MTKKELEGIAAQALNLARVDYGKGFNFLVASYFAKEGLRRMKGVEDLIVERLGSDWLNSGATKDVGFRLLRMAVDLMPPEAFVFATECNMFVPTKKFYALDDPEKQKQILEPKHGHDDHHRLAREGYFRIEDALQAIAQTPELVCIRRQVVQNGKFAHTPPTTDMFSQDGFSGRIKMFGHD